MKPKTIATWQNNSLLLSSAGVYQEFRRFNIVFTLTISLFPMLVNIRRGLYANLFVDAFFALLMFLPYILNKRYKINIFEEFKFLIAFQCMLHTIFGRCYGFYDKYAVFDDILHVLGGALIGGITFSLVLSVCLHYLKSSREFSVFITSIITLGMVNTLGVGWEIAEFIGDLIFKDLVGYRLAQVDLLDTMTDLIENNVGAIVAILFLKRIVLKGFKNADFVRHFKNLIPINLID